MSQAKRDPRKMVEFIRLLQTRGPNIDAIAKQIGVHEETVRYWYKEKLLSRGFVIQPTLNYARLGLKRIVAIAEVAPQYLPASKRIFVDMGTRGYLQHYTGTIPLGTHILAPCVPVEHVDSYSGFLRELQNRGLFSELRDVLIFDWWRNIPMDASRYDFSTHRWDVDLAGDAAGSLQSMRSEKKAAFDGTDLRILEQMQADANKRMSDIAKFIGISHSSALRHYKHILEQELVEFYRINWLGSSYAPETGKVMTGKHHYMALTVTVKELEKGELRSLMTGFHRLPFLWSEAGGQHYECELFVPLDLANDIMTFIAEVVRPVRKRAAFFIENQNDALGFSIEPNLYDQKRRMWTFDPASALESLDKLLLTIKASH